MRLTRPIERFAVIRTREELETGIFLFVNGYDGDTDTDDVACHFFGNYTHKQFRVCAAILSKLARKGVISRSDEETYYFNENGMLRQVWWRRA